MHTFKGIITKDLILTDIDGNKVFVKSDTLVTIDDYTCDNDADTDEAAELCDKDFDFRSFDYSFEYNDQHYAISEASFERCVPTSIANSHVIKTSQHSINTQHN